MRRAKEGGKGGKKRSKGTKRDKIKDERRGGNLSISVLLLCVYTGMTAAN